MQNSPKTRKNEGKNRAKETKKECPTSDLQERNLLGFSRHDAGFPARRKKDQSPSDSRLV